MVILLVHLKGTHEGPDPQETKKQITQLFFLRILKPALGYASLQSKGNVDQVENTKTFVGKFFRIFHQEGKKIWHCLYV